MIVDRVKIIKEALMLDGLIRLVRRMLLCPERSPRKEPPARDEIDELVRLARAVYGEA